jgi:hypothetical protein
MFLPVDVRKERKREGKRIGDGEQDFEQRETARGGKAEINEIGVANERGRRREKPYLNEIQCPPSSFWSSGGSRKGKWC